MSENLSEELQEESSDASVDIADDQGAEGVDSDVATFPDIGLEAVLDVPVTLSLEVGRARMRVRDLVGLSPGSVVKLDRAAGDSLDILVNDCLVARGEVVVVNERFGVRLTDIVSSAERIKRVK